jgi:hypothetical protein
MTAATHAERQIAAAAKRRIVGRIQGVRMAART